MSFHSYDRKISYAYIKELDDELFKKNLMRRSIRSDGNCFYDAVSHQLFLLGQQLTAEELRRQFVEYLHEHDKIGDLHWLKTLDTGETKEEYLGRHSTDKEYADDIILKAAAASLGYVIHVVMVNDSIKVEPEHGAQGEITVGRIQRDKYVSIEAKEENGNSSGSPLFPRSSSSSIHFTGILKQPNQSDEVDMGSGSFHYISEPTDLANNEVENDAGASETTYLLPEDGSTPSYDPFNQTPRKDDARMTSSTVKFFRKLFKLISYFLFGGAVFSGAIIGKAALMVLVNSAKPYTPQGTDAADQELLLIEHDVIRAWSYVILLVMLLVPEILTMAHSLYKMIMKPKKWIEMKYLLWGGLWEILHAFGESILILKVFPHMDSTLAMLILPLVGIVPACVRLHAKATAVQQDIAEKKENYKKKERKETFLDSEQKQKKKSARRHNRDMTMAVFAIVFQLLGIATLFYGFFAFMNEGESSLTYIWAVVGVILASMRYWENFVSANFCFSKNVVIEAEELHEELDSKRHQTSFVYSFIKCLILTGMTFFVFVVWENETYTSNYVMVNLPFGSSAKNEPFSATRYNKIIGLLFYNKGQASIRNQVLQQLWYVMAVQVCSSFGAFFFGRVACMTMIQPLAYTLPLILVTPALSACSAALAVYKKQGYKNGLLGFFNLAGKYKGITTLTYYIDWNNILFASPFENAAQGPIIQAAHVESKAALFVIVGLILGWAALLLITHFTWANPNQMLEGIEMLFVKPLYGGPMIDQVLLLNRRQFEKKYTKNQQEIEEKEEKDNEQEKKGRRKTTHTGPNKAPQLFACATMWHENEEEMTQLLTSLMRMDKKEGETRENRLTDKDYYEFQAHIWFDDAMTEPQKQTEEPKKLNEYVHRLCSLIPVAANKVENGKGDQMHIPVIFPTPYGGRLEFAMPHGNLLIVHLKDKDKIRHRKRWSQCMYMYYILGYLQASRKRYDLDRIFLLALDGDVDFQPEAVKFLLHRMKRNPDVGAACGRIHPIGSGPVVWFQKFEYAVGHWFQKTAEHVLGCVLCSPGCFSLFRGAALVDDNVINQYTERATKARHYVQWDQGEDRWLCTLLLKKSWRIEYTAASDSYTFAPESFGEFYEQRRRWGPSTMANVFDILMDAKFTVKNNDYISWGYISYQIGLMISSLLGPATVIMIVQGAYQYVFKWNATVALIVSLLPVIVFIILCYTTSAKTQIAVASILTILYALVMTAVIVGVIGTMLTNALLDPNNLFMIMLVGLYLITGLSHPQEMMCLIHGVLYYLCVPSAFIFLMIYSLTNLNNVSWGTRVTAESKENAQDEVQEKTKSNSKRRHVQFGPTESVYDASTYDDGSYSCALGTICQCTFCIQPKSQGYQRIPTNANPAQPVKRRRRTTMADRQEAHKHYSAAKARQLADDPKEQEKRRESIEKDLNRRVSVAEFLQRSGSRTGAMTTSKYRRLSSVHGLKSHDQRQQQLQNDEFENNNTQNDESTIEKRVDEGRRRYEDNEKIDWILDELVKDGDIAYLDEKEVEFWKYMIRQYLHPLDENEDEKKKVKKDLLDLRNQVTGAYFLLNALWIILNFALQLTITDIAISFYVNGELVVVNPVSFVFLLFFLIILLIQFFCMLKHRWSTAIHLLAAESFRGKIDEIENETPTNDVKPKLKKPDQNEQLEDATIVHSPEDALDHTAKPTQNIFMHEKPQRAGEYDNDGFARSDEEVIEMETFQSPKKSSFQKRDKSSFKPKFHLENDTGVFVDEEDANLSLSFNLGHTEPKVVTANVHSNEPYSNHQSDLEENVGIFPTLSEDSDEEGATSL